MKKIIARDKTYFFYWQKINQLLILENSSDPMYVVGILLNRQY